ncbi:MAG: uroporphyrinogen-III C-methyltransferase [Dongiaceae bacterium]
MTIGDAIDRLPYDGPMFEPGHVWLAGAGPGGIGCLTLDVVHALTQADAVVYDALVNAEMLTIAARATLHFAGKRGGSTAVPQVQINALLIELARAGKRVLRLKGGDPTMFARGGEEALELVQAGIPFRFLPGVTSALAGLAAARIPVTMRGVNKAIVFATGHGASADDDVDWAALARTGHPLVIYMGMSNLARIVAALMAGGMSADMPAAAIMSATMPDERIVVAELHELERHARAAGVAAPALIVIGEIVRVRAALSEIVRIGQPA